MGSLLFGADRDILKGWASGKVSEALTSGPKFKGAPKSSAIKVNILTHYSKIKIDVKKIHDEQEMKIVN